jgi:transcriptional regulator with XRE-family HTH domain
MARLAIHQLGDRLRRQRGERGVREVAKEVGISAATLSRVERGFVPDLETFAKICAWMGIDPGSVLGLQASKNKPRTRPRAAAATVHFKSDPTTSPKLAKALADLIIAAHEKLRTQSS